MGSTMGGRGERERGDGGRRGAHGRLYRSNSATFSYARVFQPTRVSSRGARAVLHFSPSDNFPRMTTISLEPPKLYANDELDTDLFARPARLHNVVLEDGSEVFTRFVAVLVSFTR
jgi:hypothetical protein